MQGSPSLFSIARGEAIAEPSLDSSGFLRSHLARGLVLGGALLCATSAATVALGSRCGWLTPTRSLVARIPQARMEKQRQAMEEHRRFLLEREAQLGTAVRDYQRDLQAGRGSEEGLLNLRLGHLRLRLQLLACPRAHARARQEIMQCELRLQELRTEKAARGTTANPQAVRPRHRQH